jgi:hypothetical protein
MKKQKKTHLRDGTIDISIKPGDPETWNQSRRTIHVEHQSSTLLGDTKSSGENSEDYEDEVRSMRQKEKISTHL